MNEIKNQMSKTIIYLIFFCFSAVDCNGWYWVSTEEAVQHHEEMYEKFAKEVNDVKLDLLIANKESDHSAALIVYNKVTPNLLPYRAAFDQLDGSVVLNEVFKSFLIGLPLGYCIASLKNFGMTIPVSLIGMVIYSILSVLHENNTYGKQPYFDRFLVKHENYFSNSSLNTRSRMFASFMYLLCGAALSGIFHLIDSN